MEIVSKNLSISFDVEDIEKLDFLLREAAKSENLSDYDREFVIRLRNLIDYESLERGRRP